MSQNKIIIEGKTYISASRAAELSSYSGDYIGQLCRGKKIDSKMISRSWFVEENSLLQYKINSQKNLQNHYDNLSQKLSSDRVSVVDKVSVQDDIIGGKAYGIQDEIVEKTNNKSLKYSFEQGKFIPKEQISEEQISNTKKPFNFSVIKRIDEWGNYFDNDAVGNDFKNKLESDSSGEIKSIYSKDNSSEMMNDNKVISSVKNLFENHIISKSLALGVFVFLSSAFISSFIDNNPKVARIGNNALDHISATLTPILSPISSNISFISSPVVSVVSSTGSEILNIASRVLSPISDDIFILANSIHSISSPFSDFLLAEIINTSNIISTKWNSIKVFARNSLRTFLGIVDNQFSSDNLVYNSPIESNNPIILSNASNNQGNLTKVVEKIINKYPQHIVNNINTIDTSNLITRDFLTKQVDTIYISIGKAVANLSSGSSISNLSSFDTDNLAEGSNLYFTNARVASYISSSTTVPHAGGNSWGDVLYWNGSGWATTATSTLNITAVTYDNTNVNAYIHGSTTIAKAYTANTFTNLQQFNNASTSLFSVHNRAYFGATATSTFGSDGVLTLASALAVTSGGTGQTAFGQGWIGINNSGAFISSTSPTVAYITATSTTLASTFPYASTTALSVTTLCLTGDTCRTTWPSGGSGGGLGWASSTAPDTNSIYSLALSNVGIGTSSPYAKLSVVGQAVAAYFTATTSTASVFPYASTTALSSGNAWFSGNVGIGTTTSSYPLNVVSSTYPVQVNTRITSETALARTALALELYTTSTMADGFGSLLEFLSRDSDGTSNSVAALGSYRQGADNAGGLQFQTNDGTGIPIRMVLDKNGNLGIGTTSPYAKLSVVGQAVASYFTATTSTASIFPYASSTAITVSGANGLTLASLNGPLQANAGAVSATTSIGVLYGGTGLTSAPSYGNLLVGNSSSGYKLSATSTLGIAISDTTGTLTVARGGTGQTAFAQGWLHSDGTTFTSSTSPTVNYITATSTTLASTFPYASTTMITSATASTTNLVVSGQSLFSDGTAALPSSSWLSDPDTGWFKEAANRIAFSAAGTARLYIDAIRIHNMSGAVGTPSYSFAADTTTGMWYGGSNSIAFSANGAESMRMLSGGNIGIGTTTPYAKLSVVGEVVSAYFTATTSTASVFPYASSTAITVSGLSYLSGGFLASASSTLQNFTGVNATTTSLAVLNLNSANCDVKSTTSGSLYCGTDATGGGSGSGSWSTTTSQVSGQYTNYPNNNTDIVTIGNTSTTSAKYWFDPNSLTSYLSGNVGIGIVSPTANLTVVKNYAEPAGGVASTTVGVFSNSGAANGTSSIAILSRSSAISGINFGTELGERSGWIEYGLAASPYQGMRFGVIGTERMVLDGSGRLGIGTTTPWRTLSVNGSSDLGTNALAGYFIATTSTASVFPYASTTALSSGNAWFSGNVGIGTTSPWGSLSVTNTGSAPSFVVEDSTSPDTTPFIIDASGNVGVGTTTMTTKLSIYGDTLAGTLSSIMGSSGNLTDYIQVGGTDLTDKAGIIFVIRDGIQNSRAWIDIDATNKLLEFDSTYTSNGALDYDFQHLDTSLLRIKSNGNVGIGTTSPYAKLSVVGQAVASYFTATTSTASIFPYASSTAITVSGANGLTLASLNGPLQANAGAVSATTSIGVLYGGTGLTSAPSYGNLLVGNSSSGYKLSATSTLGIAISDTTGTLTVARGGTGQTAFAQGWLHSDGTTFTSSTSPTVNYITATSTTLASTFPYASTTVISSSGFAYFATSGGKVGIGTTTPFATLAVNPTAGYASHQFVVGSSTATSLLINNTGLVGIGTTSPISTLSIQGSLCVRDTGSCGTTAGTIYATTAAVTDIDLAENYPTTDKTLSAGEIVMFDDVDGQIAFIKRANKSDKGSIAGIISTAPGILLGKDLTNITKPVALSGRVPVKVNNENGSIAVGDRIALSSTAGVGMRASLSGETVGIALESFTASSTNGVIEVFVNLRNNLDLSPLDLATKDIGELNLRIDLMASSTVETTSGLIATFFSSIKEWVGDKVTVVTGYFKEIFTDKLTTKELCIEDVCVNKEQLQALLTNAGIASSTPAQTATSTEKTAPMDTPVVPTISPVTEVISTPSPSPEAITSSSSSSTSSPAPSATPSTESSSETSTPVASLEATSSPSPEQASPSATPADSSSEISSESSTTSTPATDSAPASATESSTSPSSSDSTLSSDSAASASEGGN